MPKKAMACSIHLRLAACFGSLDSLTTRATSSKPRIPGRSGAGWTDPFQLPNLVRHRKGRTILRCSHLCLEKFIGQSLPETPNYKNIQSWGLYLEKGPIWIRPFDDQATITPADIGRISAASPNGGVWVYGYVRYLNLLDEPLEYKFLWRWDLEHGFVPENRPNYT